MGYMGYVDYMNYGPDLITSKEENQTDGITM